MFSLKSKVGPKGQAVIPKPVRDEAGIVPGDEIYFRMEEGVIVIEKKAGGKILDEFLGAVKHKKRAPRKVDWDKRYGSQFRAKAR